MADPKPKTNGLTKKLGPLPIWAWAVAGLAVGYLLYRHFSSVGGGSPTPEQTVAQQGPSPSLMGATPSAGAPQDTGAATSDLLSSLGGERQDLLGALLQTQQDVVGLANAQIAYAQTNTSLGSFNTQTQPAVASDPGGGNTPVYVYLSPSVAPSQSLKPATTTVTGAKQTGASTRYYTYKRDVPLGSGQTVHFTSGRGYYAYG